MKNHGLRGQKGQVCALPPFLLLVAALLLTSGAADAALTGYYYYSTGGTAPNFGSLIMTRSDADVNFNWGTGSPGGGVPVENFCVSWRGVLTIPTEGDWTFYTLSDDGARLYVDGQRIIEFWQDHGATVEQSGTRFLTAGKHDIVLDYYENTGGARIELRYSGPGVGKQIIPSSATSPLPTSPTGLLGRWYTVNDCAGNWGTLAGNRVDGNISFGDGFIPPYGLPVEYFGGRWVGRINIPTTGNWTFYSRTDDAVRFYIQEDGSGNLMRRIDHWGGGGAEYSSPPIFLHGGLHNIAVDFFECTGQQYMELRWQGPNQGKDIVPQSALFQHQNGLIAEFFNNQAVSGVPAVFRNDYYLKFSSWGGPPQDSIGGDNFSVRWRGKIYIPTSGDYTFYSTTDDGTELWVNGQRIIDWFSSNNGMTERTSSLITLTGGRRYFIDWRMRENDGGAGAELRWSGPGIAKQFVSDQNLFPILNETPTGIALDKNYFYDDEGLNATVGNLSTTDPDNTSGGSQSHTYTLVAGVGDTHNGSFSISGNQLRVNNAAMALGTYSVRIRTTDNGQIPDRLYTEQAFTISCLTAPTVTNVTSSLANGYYKAGQVVPVQITFSKNVTVQSGPPYLALNSGGAATATYASGSGTSTLTFNYTVAAGENSTDLDYMGVGALNAGGGTIRDVNGKDAVLTLAAPGAAGSLGFNKDLVIDTIAPTVSSIVRQTPSGQATNAAQVTWRVTFGEDVTGSVGATDFTFTPTGTLSGYSVQSVTPFGSGGTTYDVLCNTGTGDGILRLDVVTPAAVISDLAGNNLTANYTTGQTYIVDKTAPTPPAANAPAYDNASPIPVGYGASTDNLTGVASVRLWYKKGAGGTWTDSGMSGVAGGGTFNFIGMTGEDTYYFDVVVTDNAGNSSPAASGDGDSSTIYDTTPPTAPSASSPAYDNASPIPVTYGVSSDNLSGVALVRLWYKKGAGGAWTNSGLSGV
ncbi:MAG TPA: PA14 domain-containing protein, partial [Candidatus Hydrogenedentes bacterium]|nr:PA14 domain-containing protein [Candidatus Hydrogenedentota bacterium]